MEGITYVPAALEVVSRVAPVLSFRRVIFALGTAAPVGSFTVPLTEVLSDCAQIPNTVSEASSIARSERTGSILSFPLKQTKSCLVHSTRVFECGKDIPCPGGVNSQRIYGEEILRGIYSRRAASLAKYVNTKSAPARRMAISDSIIARSWSIQPFRAAAIIIENSPETW